jgi:hypothetical protein
MYEIMTILSRNMPVPTFQMLMMMNDINFSDLLVLKICTVFVSRTSGSARSFFYISTLLTAVYPDS